MKRSKQVWALSSIILIVFLIACVALSPNTTNEVTAIQETAIAAASTALVQTMTAMPTAAVVPTDTVPATLSTTPTVTPLPDFESTQIPGLLQSALTVETVSNFNGHTLQRISGWKYGFYNIEWLNTNHLMLYPFAGVTNAVTDRTVAGTYPAVINLDSKKFWIPHLSRAAVDGRASFPWSAQLGVLIMPGPNDEVSLFGPDGNRMQSYPGNLLGVSPSATKLLIDGDTWIDLSTGKTVDFSWYQTGRAAEYTTYAHFRPIWSPDEMRVYICCYAYGDARTGKSYVMPFDEITIDGKKGKGDLLALHGIWVLNDKYILPWGGVWEGPLFTVYLFDPAAKTFRDASRLTGIPYGSPNGNEPYCYQPSAQNGGRYVWVDCRDGSYLIDLATFRSQAYPLFGGPYGDSTYTTPEIDWSADGTFAKMSGTGFESILSTTTKELKPLPKNCSGFNWHPKDNVLTCMLNDGQNLLILDAQTISVLRETTLPNKFYKMGWSPDGKHLALLARDDNSFWQIDYPGLDNLEQLTLPMPELTRQTPKYDIPLIKNVIWSADNTALAFIGAQDIYIVNMGRIP